MIRDGCRRSAAAVVPLVMEQLVPRRVIDVGCGEGWWAAEFARHGCDVLGIDGGPDAAAGIRYGQADLADPLPHLGLFDLAVCLEVAEHLPPERADSFVADLCGLAPAVVFSAAIPGQGGHGHLNEQWPGYWVDRFEARGYRCTGALRWLIWDDDRVENWYRQNLIVATVAPWAAPSLFDTPLAPVWPVVHPILYDARRP